MSGFLADPLLMGKPYIYSCLWFCLSVHSYLNCFNIFGSVRDIFLISFGDIPRMFVHCFQPILNLLYVCQFVSWLTSLLKLDKCKDISSSE